MQLQIFGLGVAILTSVSGLAKPLCPNCNVILIAMDSLGAKHISHLGYARNTTPKMDAFAQKGFSFKNNISPSSWTVPTYLSIFTSTYPSIHGLTNRYLTYTPEKKELADFTKFTPSLTTMAEFFKKSGYATVGYTGDAGVGSPLGYGSGFDIYFDKIRFGGFDTTVNYAVDWLKANSAKGRFFMFLHGYDSHGQHKLPENYKSKFQSSGSSKYKGTIAEQAELREMGLAGKMPKFTKDDMEFWQNWYDGKINDADERLGKFLEALESMGLMKSSIIVLFSDHGDEYFEHGFVDHGHTLYDELVRVPLVFYIPNLKGGKIYSEQVSTIDLFPTLVEALNLKASPTLQSQFKGQSLAKNFTGAPLLSRDIFTETDYRNFTHKRAIQSSDGWKYIITLENGQGELYNLKSDPNEQKNLVEANQEKRNQLRKKLMKHLDKDLPATRAMNSSSGCLPAYPGQCD